MNNKTNLLEYNDNELLYLIKEGTEEALEILFAKYSFYIKLKIKEMYIEKNDYDDFFQEGLIALRTAINKFNEMNANSFFTFFDVILKRKFIDLLRKIKRENTHLSYGLAEEYLIDVSGFEKKYILEEPVNLTSLEKEVFDKKFRCFLKNSIIAKELGKSTKAIYSTIERIKNKCKNKK